MSQPTLEATYNPPMKKQPPDITHPALDRPAGDQTLFMGRFLGLVERRGWEIATRTNATGVVVIIAITKERELVLVEQERIPINSATIELPAGLAGDQGAAGEALETAARRELWEETGYEADQLVHLTRCPSSAGMTDEMLDFFLAPDVVKTGEGGGDGNEDITVHTVPLASIDQWMAQRLAAGYAYDPKVYTALYWLERQEQLPELLPRN